MVFYRKYRPQKITELDLTIVRDKFTQLLKSNDLPHAFLFTGPKGLGKTSSARILAKAINCKSRNNESRIKNNEVSAKSKNHNSSFDIRTSSEIEPCNSCDICTSITDGSHVDVLEIDAASNRGIDEIRELRERIKFSPAQLKHKIYIIDEVHMLTTEAFNALLKTLEEPPSHVIFILCTTEEWKIPPTITSRTFHVRFEKPSKEELVRSLQRIVAGEKLDVDATVLEEIFALSDGAFRNGAKILEELVFHAQKKKITSQTLEDVFKTESTDQYVAKLLDHIVAKNASEALGVIQQIAEGGIDFKVVYEKLSNLLHEQLLIKSNLKSGAGITDISISQIKHLLELLNSSYGQLRFAVLPQLPLEIAVLEYFMSEDSSQVQDVKTVVSVEKETEIAAQPVTESVHTQATADTDTHLMGKLIDAVKKDNHSLAGILRGCTVVGVKKGVVTIGSKFKFHGDRLSDPAAKKLLEKSATEIIGKETKIEITILN